VHADELPIGSRYLVSLYYALMQISTVGYGDLVPQSATELGIVRAFTIITLPLQLSPPAHTKTPPDFFTVFSPTPCQVLMLLIVFLPIFPWVVGEASTLLLKFNVRENECV
jgi:hypothetical protein